MGTFPAYTGTYKVNRQASEISPTYTKEGKLEEGRQDGYGFAHKADKVSFWK